MKHLWVGLSVMPEEAYRAAILPLLAAKQVEVLEWSFDTAWGRSLPSWLETLLDDYSEQDRLLGHGVTYSPLSGEWTKREEEWLRCMTEEVHRRRYRHVSEHFGFMTAGNFHQSAPLPVPRTSAALEAGQDRLKRLRMASGLSVGLENLAFAFSAQDVHDQGPFLDDLLAPSDGFLVLDLHNIYCQMWNFKKGADELLDRYPLHRVRELHVSGGSWSSPNESAPIRRDTHDGPVPEKVYELVPLALQRCPNVEAIIFERVARDLDRREEQQIFQEDYQKLLQLVRQS